jgi:tetratricopeptide (TPR) repeat protein
MEWFEETPRGYQDFAELLVEARKGNPRVLIEIAHSIRQGKDSGIVRATLISATGGLPAQLTQNLITEALIDQDPMVRMAAAHQLQNFPAASKMRLGLPLLKDPVKSVRIATTASLLDLNVQELTQQQAALFTKALREYRKSLESLQDRPEGHTSLAELAMRERKFSEAVEHYQEAIRLDPMFVPAYVNWAQMLAELNQESAAVDVLRQGINANPNSAALFHSLGLSKVRQKNLAEALSHLETAANKAPENARFSYVYAVGLQNVGRVDEAVRVLEQSRQRHPFHIESLIALANYYQQLGMQDKSDEIIQDIRQMSNIYN